MRNTAWVGIVALALVATSATGCCRGRSSSSSSSSGSGAGIGTPGGTFRAGDVVDVEWNGSWWQSRILSVNGGLYRVHYLGWASSWDESVPARRVRAPSGLAKRGTGKD